MKKSQKWKKSNDKLLYCFGHTNRNWLGGTIRASAALMILRQRDFIPLESQRANQLEHAYKRFPPVWFMVGCQEPSGANEKVR